MINTVVAEDLDGWFRGNNDIMILAKSALGDKPKVERIVFYGEEIPKGEPLSNFYANSIFQTDDYDGESRLWLEVNILEIDTDLGERKAAISAFQSLASTAGAVFPVLLPYAMGASAGVGLVKKLVNALENNINVIKVPIAFYPGKIKRGYPPLQEGQYVVFANPQDPDNFKLSSNGLLEGKNVEKISYAVFDIIEGEERVSPEVVKNQKIATLLTQLRSGNINTTKASIEFLDETLSAYSNYQKLERYLELKNKADRTDDEKAIMERIKKIDDLKPYLKDY